MKAKGTKGENQTAGRLGDSTDVENLPGKQVNKNQVRTLRLITRLIRKLPEDWET